MLDVSDGNLESHLKKLIAGDYRALQKVLALDMRSTKAPSPAIPLPVPIV